MKKTISINIGGIIFHIEEDGYDKLKNYLDSVNKYFSTFEDSSEIVSDIEGRIAELFLLKLTDGRQTLTLEDVDELISTMGTTRDFEASIEDDEPAQKSENTEKAPEEEKAEASTEPKRLYRDTKRSILGGVASGIAYYFSIDPLWIRLLTLALFINVFFYGLSGATFVAYIILWIVLPPKNDLQENQKVKKLYRNPQGRVLGGVSTGIAAYFGIDVVVVRLLFVLSIFLGGSGIITYIILWIITPEANSITEKMQMEGKPVTIKNIEDNVKKSLNVKEGEESPLLKVIFFPFRLIALILSALGKVLGPVLRFLVDAIRIFFGALLILIGFSMVAALLGVTLGISGMGFFENSVIIDHAHLPLDMIRSSINVGMAAGVFLITFVPALGLCLLGVVVIIQRRVANGYVGWSLFSLWLLGIVMTALTVPGFVKEFSETETIKSEVSFALTQATPTLHLNDIGHDPFDAVELKLRGYDDSTFVAYILTESRGSDREEAEDNARAVTFKIEQKGEDFYFDSKTSYSDTAKFRFQNVEATFYIPYDKVFRMDGKLSKILSNTIHHYGYKNYQIADNEWVFKKDGGLTCLTCKSYEYKYERKESASSEDEDWDFDFTPNTRSYEDADELNYPFENFKELKISSIFDIEVTKSTDGSFDVNVKGKERDLDEVYLNQVGDRLEVRFGNGNWKSSGKNDRRVKLLITMPSLAAIDLEGWVQGEITGFDEENMHVEISGESDVYLNVNSEYLSIDMDGMSRIDLKGKGDQLKIEMDGSSKLNGTDYLAKKVKIETNGAARASIYGQESIKAYSDGRSSIKYKGSSNLTLEEDGSSSIERSE